LVSLFEKKFVLAAFIGTRGRFLVIKRGIFETRKLAIESQNLIYNRLKLLLVFCNLHLGFRKSRCNFKILLLGLFWPPRETFYK